MDWIISKLVIENEWRGTDNVGKAWGVESIFS